jgi:hypothetical protein
MTQSFLPQRVIFVPADAQKLKQAELVRQHVSAADKRRHPLTTKLWRNHVVSVMGFRRYLWRKGGQYSSFMASMRHWWRMR